jgi:hypothetical protein
MEITITELSCADVLQNTHNSIHLVRLALPARRISYPTGPNLHTDGSVPVVDKCLQTLIPESCPLSF